MVIGEMGGFYTGDDKVWQDWAIDFIRERGMGIFYFALNPGSEDTGGLLKADYTTPERDKLALLSRLPSTDVLSVRSRARPLSDSPPPSPSPSPPPIRQPPPPSPPPVVVRDAQRSTSPPPPMRRPSPPPPPPPVAGSPPPSPRHRRHRPPPPPSESPLLQWPSPPSTPSPPPPEVLGAEEAVMRDAQELLETCAADDACAGAAAGGLVLMVGLVGVAALRTGRARTREGAPAARKGQAGSRRAPPGRRRSGRRPRSHGHQRIGDVEADSASDDDSHPLGPSANERERRSRQRQAPSRSKRRDREARGMRLPEACASGDEDSAPPTSLSVTEIKEQLAQLSVSFADCLEKGDLARRLEEAQEAKVSALLVKDGKRGLEEQRLARFASSLETALVVAPDRVKGYNVAD